MKPIKDALEAGVLKGLPSPSGAELEEAESRHPSKLDRIAHEFLSGEYEEAVEAGELGFYARILVHSGA